MQTCHKFSKTYGMFVKYCRKLMSILDKFIEVVDTFLEM